MTAAPGGACQLRTSMEKLKMRSRYLFFAVLAVVAVLTATVAPETLAAHMDPGALALGIALAGAGIVGDIQFVKAKELREKRAGLVLENQRCLDKLKGETDQARIKELETEWDRRDAEIISLEEQILETDKQEGRESRQRALDVELSQPLNPSRRSGRVGPDMAADDEAPIMYRNIQSGEVVRGVRGDQSIALACPGIPRAAGRIGDLIGSIIRGRPVSPEIEREFRTMSTTGGYAVPEPYALQFIDLARADSVVMKAGASTIRMEGQTLKLARITADPTAAWKTENNAFSASDVTLDAVTLTANTLGVLVKMSEELAMDSPNIGQIVEKAIRGAMGVKLDAAALVGSGAAPEPQGIYGASDVQTQVVGGVPTDFAFFSLMVQKVRVANHEPNAAIWNPRDLGTLDRLVDTTGQPKRPPESFNRIAHFSTTGIPITYENGASPNDASIAIVGKFDELVFAPRIDVRIIASRVSNDGTDSAMAKFQVHIQAVMRCDFGIFRGAAFCVGTGIDN